MRVSHRCITSLVVLSAVFCPGPSPGQPEPAPAPRPAASADERRAALSGTWVMVEVEAGGEVHPAFFVRDRVTIDAKAGTFRRSYGSPFAGGYTERGTFEVAADGKGGLRVELAFTRYGGFGEGPSRETRETGRAVWKMDGEGRLRA